MSIRSETVSTLPRQTAGERRKKHDPFAGIIQIKFLPYNLSRSGAVEALHPEVRETRQHPDWHRLMHSDSYLKMTHDH
jgi:hypothetical protein